LPENKGSALQEFCSHFWGPTPWMIEALYQLSPFDPEHVPEEFLLTEAFHERFPKLPQIGCFDMAWMDWPASRAQRFNWAGR
jgi:acetate kinase